MAWLLWLLRLSVPQWPLHPVGLLMVGTFYGSRAWVSVLIGRLLKVLILRYGGARLYRKSRPLFIGLIMGEIFAAVFWSIEPAIRVAMDMPYKVINVLPR